MPSRMDRYKDEKIDNNNLSRSNKNRSLYDEFDNNTKYASIADVSKLTAVDLNEAKKTRTRENYQRIKEYDIANEKPAIKKELDEINYLYQDHENRIYDINSILKEAKKNREKVDDLEKKRKLKNEDFNAVTAEDKELEKFHKEKQSKEKIKSDDKIKNLIDTIASKTLSGELDFQTSTDLLSNLMANEGEERIEAIEHIDSRNSNDSIDDKKEEKDNLEISRQIIDRDAISLADTAKALASTSNRKTKKNSKKPLEKTIDDIFKDMDKSFYTKSMDLSDKDFVSSLNEEKESKHILLKIFFGIMLLIIVLTIVYFVVFNGDIENVMKLFGK